jgi:molybdopterin biosynthesis enzyme
MDMTVVLPVPPQTILYGRLTDAQLHGLLALCQNLGLQVVAVREAPSAAITASGRPLSSPSTGPS